jgi:hypothetical protein
LVAVSHSGGASLSGITGNLRGHPLPLLVCGLLCAAVPLPRQLRHTWARLVLGTVLGLLALTAVILHAADGGFDLEQYYPKKMLWFLTAALGPSLALGATAGTTAVVQWTGRQLARAGRAAFVLRVTVAGVVVAVIGAFWLPTAVNSGAATVGTWSVVDAGGLANGHATLSAQRYQLARTYADAYPNRVVVPYFVGSSAIFDPMCTRMVAELIAFRSVARVPLEDGLGVCVRIRKTAGRRAVVVVTRLPLQLVLREMREEGCPSRAPVVKAPGEIQHVALLFLRPGGRTLRAPPLRPAQASP